MAESIEKFPPYVIIIFQSLWWIVNWLIIENTGVLELLNSLTSQTLLSLFLGAVISTSFILFPALELLYFYLFKYSLGSLTTILLICTVSAIGTTINPLFAIPFAATPLFPLFLQGLSPITEIRKVRDKIVIEAKISLFSFSVIDITLVGLGIVLWQIGIINLNR
jgi:hypothetical protein